MSVADAEFAKVLDEIVDWPEFDAENRFRIRACPWRASAT